ncbi:MAG: hypothetical protein K0Q68_1394 [Moraxellaceae bacterium]|jgi:hypothetical protein|nr:hypothetical protein [Moraxellaceae bacterium]
MRMLSLLITLGIVAWLVYSQFGSGGAGQAAQAPQVQAKQKAAAVDAQVQDQFARQAEQLSRMEGGEAPVQP